MKIELDGATEQRLTDLSLMVERGEAARLEREGMIRMLLLDNGIQPSKVKGTRFADGKMFVVEADTTCNHSQSGA